MAYIRIYDEEGYPHRDFHEVEAGGYAGWESYVSEVDSPTLDRWRRVMHDFHKVQNEMEQVEETRHARNKAKRDK